MSVFAVGGIAAICTRRRRLFADDALSLVAATILGVLLLVAVVGPYLPLGNPDAIAAGPRLGGPTWQFLAGTDSLGRSVLPRLVDGVRTTFLLSGMAVVISVAVGLVVGMVAAYYAGLVGELIVRAADVVFAFPALLLALLIVAILGPGERGAVVSIAIITIPMMVRVVRAAALSVVSRDFVVASKVGGARAPRILFRHVLPNVAGTVAVQGTYAMSVGMLVESGLSFLGLGVQPPNSSLGSLVNQGSVYLPVAPWLVLIPGFVLALAITSVNLVGDGLRDRLDVRGAEVRR